MSDAQVAIAVRRQIQVVRREPRRGREPRDASAALFCQFGETRDDPFQDPIAHGGFLLQGVDAVADEAADQVVLVIPRCTAQEIDNRAIERRDGLVIQIPILQPPIEVCVRPANAADPVEQTGWEARLLGCMQRGLEVAPRHLCLGISIARE